MFTSWKKAEAKAENLFMSKNKRGIYFHCERDALKKV